MRNKHLLLALIVVLLSPAIAGAATLDQLTATADCNAWGSEVTIAFRPGATMVLLVFSMQVADSAGVELERYDFEQWLTIPATPVAVYPFGAPWQAALDRAATVTVTADVYDARGDSFSLTGDVATVALACGATGSDDPPADVCRHGSRWWRRHLAQWPVSSLTLGGVTYDAAQVLRLLRAPFALRVERRLAHQLAVVKLNLANGVTNDIADQVAAADAWLAAHPLDYKGRRAEPRNQERREALRLIKVLHRWNHDSCRDGSALDGDDDTVKSGDAGLEFTGDLADYDATEKAAEENLNLGSLKAMFR